MTQSKAIVGGVVVALGVVCAVAASCAEAGSDIPGAEAPTSERIPASSGGWAPGKPDFPSRRAAASAVIAEASRTLETAGNSCGDACPAVTAYREGVKKLCEVSENKDDYRLCRDYKKALVAAETKLKPDCGICGQPGDASATTDDDAGPL